MAEKKKFNAWIPNFGAKGWGITLVCFVFCYFYGFWNSSTNTLLPILTEQHGWLQTDMSYAITVAGWISLIGIALFGAIGRRYGAKLICMIGLVGSAIGFGIMAVMTTFPMFVIAVIVFQFAMVAYGTVGLGMLGSSWFPRTKGAFMGIATIGLTAASAIGNPLILAFVGSSLGLPGFCWACAIVLVVMAVVTGVFVKNNPEEAGAYPDNDRSITREQLDAEFKAAQEYRKNSPWTLAKVLKTPQTWLIAVGLGLVNLYAGGMISILVPTLVGFGHDMLFGVGLLSGMWFIGLLGHYLIGVIDFKLGSKRTSLLIVVLLAISCVLLFFVGGNPIACALAVAFLLFSISGSANMIMSLPTSIFGREDFDIAYPPIQIIYSVFSFSGISILSTISAMAGPTFVPLAGAIICVVALIPLGLIPYKQIASRTSSGAEQAENRE